MHRVFPDVRRRAFRREFLRGGLLGLATCMTPKWLAGCSSEEARARGAPEGGSPDGGDASVVKTKRSNLANLGPLLPPDENGVSLPEGFTSRIVARAGEPPIAGKSFLWHHAPDGGATFAAPDGGYVYVSNAELLTDGGASALRFDGGGELVDAYPIHRGSVLNCAGGPTPWNTWLTCEEHDSGHVIECDPFGEREAIPRPALGVFKHEAVAVDLVNQHLYFTEDRGDGCFYRYVPDGLTGDGFADLDAGRLEVATVGSDGTVTWTAVSDPRNEGAVPTRLQVEGSTVFDGGEGIWYHAGVVYFSTKGDNRVWAYDVVASKLEVLYDAATAPNPTLRGVDNLTGTCCGDVLVAEDGDDMQIVAILADGSLKPIVQVVGHTGSEITGPAFDPSGQRLYFSSQRPTGMLLQGGITYEVTGPFHVFE